MADTDGVFLYLVGTAGSGKSRLTAGLQRWMQEHSLDAIAVNLDPGAESLPYVPDVDIRDWVKVRDIMAQHGLGPNGAQVAAADMLALQAEDVMEAIGSFRSDLVLLDTPGQMELFVFREAGRHIVERFAPGRSALAFLVDPFLARNPAAFVTQILLAATTQFRFQVPMVNVLTKTDLLQPEELEKLQRWMEEPDELHDAIAADEPTMYHHLNTSIFRVLEELGTYTRLTPASAETLEGLDDVYAFLQNAFAGAEDLAPR
ncbi:MAG TPA: ATP/GTP-binding protein [Candidatus Thermoplasmatota archaeon]|nr:ATP/GTP-binding protein [Candidatus Thermoplasmatota archaeon]